TQREWKRPGGRLHPADPPEAAHQLLERSRAARRVERYDLAVQDERRGAQVAASDVHDVGQTSGDVREPAAIDGDALAVAMELNTRAVVLVFHGGLAAVGGQRLTDVACDLGEHRQERD